MFFFLQKLDGNLVDVGPEAIGPQDVEIKEGVLRFDKSQFRLSDVMLASINIDTVPNDGIGGSALFKTREFEPSRGVVQKIYKGTFDDKAIEVVSRAADMIKNFGGTVKNHTLSDDAFRRAFF